MDDIYREHLIDHYKNPRNFGELADADVTVKEANASCGDIFEISVKFQKRKSKPIRRAQGESEKVKAIQDIKFRGVGCAISTAAFSMLVEKVKSQKSKVKDLKMLTEKDMVEMLGIEVSPTRMKCATLPLRALHKALESVISNDKS